MKARLFQVLLLLVVTMGFAASTAALPPKCNDCGATCTLTYETGWNDCFGSPSNCIRETVCP